ncbi:adenylyltransferase/cytidyltransferase family protein [Candidatus Woesebacteria bacterium]|nr:adenylyltransferase/cytidyltransferase family protein [Candidatus Woesebacteria bacterium]
MKQVIWKYESLDQLRQVLTKKKVVLVGGCFDLIHYGHFTFLTKAQTLGDEVVIALESDEHIARYKKRQPVHTQLERATILSGLRFVDRVLLLPFFKTDAEYGQMVVKLDPDIIAVSHPDRQLSHKKEHAELVGATVIEVTEVLPQFATRRIVESP